MPMSLRRMIRPVFPNDTEYIQDIDENQQQTQEQQAIDKINKRIEDTINIKDVMILAYLMKENKKKN